MEKKEVSVDKNTSHSVIEMKKGLIIIWKIIQAFFGLTIAYMLYDKCLFCTECNDFVVIYFALVSLVLFLSVGLPVDKLLKIGNLQ